MTSHSCLVQAKFRQFCMPRAGNVLSGFQFLLWGYPFFYVVHDRAFALHGLKLLTSEMKLNGEVHNFYKTSWYVEFEALSRMVKMRGSCDKPFKRYSRLKNLLCERPQGTNSWRHWAIEKLSWCADSSHFTFFHFVLIVMHLHFGVALEILAGEKQAAKVNLGQKLSFGSSARADHSSMTSRGYVEVWPGRVTCASPALWSISIANITWTAYRTNLGPSPFDSAPRTLQTVKFCKNRELPL